MTREEWDKAEAPVIAPAVAAGYKNLMDIQPAAYLFKHLRPNSDERTLQKSFLERISQNHLPLDKTIYIT